MSKQQTANGKQQSVARNQSGCLLFAVYRF